MTLDEKILRMDEFNTKKARNRKLEQLLPINEILVVQYLDDDVLIYSDTHIQVTSTFSAKGVIECIKERNPQLKHKVIRMSLKRFKARKEVLKAEIRLKLNIPTVWVEVEEGVYQHRDNVIKSRDKKGNILYTKNPINPFGSVDEINDRDLKSDNIFVQRFHKVTA